MASTRLPHYCIVGGGLSGLATANFLAAAKPPGSYRLTLLESQERFGGWIHSVKSPKTGAIYELGPHSARATASASSPLFRLASNLNLQNSFLWMNAKEESFKQYLYVKNTLVPLDMLSLSTKEPFTRSSFGVIMSRTFSRRPQSKPDWSVDEFLRTRLDDEFADYLGSAMIRGIYAGDSRELSARACLPQLVKYEEKGPNLILGLLRSMFRPPSSSSLPQFVDSHFPQPNQPMPRGARAWSLCNGMQTLTDSLISNLLKSTDPSLVCAFTNAPAVSIDLDPSGQLSVEHLQDGERSVCLTDVDAVFLCCPSFTSAKLLYRILPMDTAQLLSKKSLPWADIASVIFETEATAKPPVRGFGHLVPRTEDDHILGMIYDSVAFPQLDSSQKTLRYTVMMRPHESWLSNDSKNLSNSTKHAIEEKAFAALDKQLSLNNPHIVDRYVGLYRDCIPQYPLGHLDNLEAIRLALGQWSEKVAGGKQIHLVGFSYDGVGLNDTVQSALQAVCRQLNIAN